MQVPPSAYHLVHAVAHALVRSRSKLDEKQKLPGTAATAASAKPQYGTFGSQFGNHHLLSWYPICLFMTV